MSHGRSSVAYPPANRDFEPCWRVGEPRKIFRRSPTRQQGFEALLAGGCVTEALAQGFRRSPTRQQGNIPVRGVALVHSGQIPITPQSKTNSRVPSAVFDCGNRNGLEQCSISCATARPAVVDSEGPSSIIKGPNIRSFVAKSVLSRFTRFLVVTAQTKHCQIGQLHD